MAIQQQAPAVHFLSPRNLLAFMAGAGLYAGIVLRNSQLVFIGFASLLALIFAYRHASKLLKTLSVKRVHHGRTFEGESVPVSLEITNDNDFVQPMVLVEDSFPPGDIYRVHHLIEQPLAPRAKIKIKYTGNCDRRRGLYTLGPVRLESSDDLGLFHRELAVEEFTFLLVYPTAVNLSMVDVLGDGTLAHVGVETIDRAGTSTEFTGTRPWRVGDSPNAIHWRSTARTGQLIVKEFQEIMTTEVTFFLDLGRLGLTGLGDQTSMEYAVKATASLAKRAVERAHAVQLYAVGKEIEHIPAGKGPRHLLMILDRLALLKSEGEAGFVDSIIPFIPMLQRGGTVVLTISATMVELEKMKLLIELMRQRRLMPLIILIDDRAFLKLYREQEYRHTKALALESIAQHLVLQGARVHLVTKAKTSEQALLQGLDREMFQ